jgi:hypothetical protein
MTFAPQTYLILFPLIYVYIYWRYTLSSQRTDKGEERRYRLAPLPTRLRTPFLSFHTHMHTASGSLSSTPVFLRGSINCSVSLFLAIFYHDSFLCDAIPPNSMNAVRKDSPSSGLPLPPLIHAQTHTATHT